MAKWQRWNVRWCYLKIHTLKLLRAISYRYRQVVADSHSGTQCCTEQFQGWHEVIWMTNLWIRRFFKKQKQINFNVNKYVQSKIQCFGTHYKGTDFPLRVNWTETQNASIFRQLRITKTYIDLHLLAIKSSNFKVELKRHEGFFVLHQLISCLFPTKQ